MSINLIATTTFGLEAVVKRECQALGFENIKTSDGKVEFTGTEAIQSCYLYRAFRSDKSTALGRLDS